MSTQYAMMKMSNSSKMKSHTSRTSSRTKQTRTSRPSSWNLRLKTKFCAFWRKITFLLCPLSPLSSKSSAKWSTNWTITSITNVHCSQCNKQNSLISTSRPRRNCSTSGIKKFKIKQRSCSSSTTIFLIKIWKSRKQLKRWRETMDEQWFKSKPWPIRMIYWRNKWKLQMLEIMKTS